MLNWETINEAKNLCKNSKVALFYILHIGEELGRRNNIPTSECRPPINLTDCSLSQGLLFEKLPYQ